MNNHLQIMKFMHVSISWQCCIQKMWLGGGGQNECFKNVGGDKGVYNVLTFQKSREARAHIGTPAWIYLIHAYS